MIISRFLSPHWLWFILILSLSIPLFFLIIRKKTVFLKKVLGPRAFPYLTQSVSRPKVIAHFFLSLLSLIFLFMALARPQSGEQKKEVKVTGIEVMMLIDVSTSMLAEDIKPSRLILAKKELIKWVDLSQGHKMGLIAFAGSSALISPLTTDRSALKMFIESITPDSVSSQGTNFKAALEQARDSLKNGGLKEEDQTSQQRVTQAIVIVSDGEDNEKGALETVRELRESGVKIFTLVVGTEEGGSIPLRDAFGNLQGFKRDRSGQEIISKTSGTVLKEIAEEGGGSFYPLSFGSSSIKHLIEDLQKLKQTEFQSEEMVRYTELYQLFLFISLILLVIELLLTNRRNFSGPWKGRFES